MSPELVIDENKYKLRMENVVNLQTPGFCELKATTLLNSKGEKETIYYRDFKEGSFIKTGLKLDFAIEGGGFFVLQTPVGEAYTRDGRFVLDNDGRLISRANRYPVLGDMGELIVANSDISVVENGTIYLDKDEIGKIRIAIIKNTNDLESVNGVIFLVKPQKSLEIVDKSDYKVRQGYIENSNISAVEQLGKMALDKAYDLKAKIVQMELQRLTKVSEMLR